jgi:hypothetical protein
MFLCIKKAWNYNLSVFEVFHNPYNRTSIAHALRRERLLVIPVVFRECGTSEYKNNKLTLSKKKAATDFLGQSRHKDKGLVLIMQTGI